MFVGNVLGRKIDGFIEALYADLMPAIVGSFYSPDPRFELRSALERVRLFL